MATEMTVWDFINCYGRDGSSLWDAGGHMAAIDSVLPKATGMLGEVLERRVG